MNKSNTMKNQLAEREGQQRALLFIVSLFAFSLPNPEYQTGSLK